MTKIDSMALQIAGANIGQAIAGIAAKRGTVWLDSSLRFADRGRYSYAAHSPVMEIVYQHGKLTIARDDSVVRSHASIVDAVGTIESFVNRFGWTAIGGITYEGTLSFLGLQPHQESQFPSLHFFLYDHVTSIDHDCEPVESDSQPWSASTHADSPHVVRQLNQARYEAHVLEIKRRIFEGDIYQANLTHRFDIRSGRQPFDVYRTLRQFNPSPYSAYMNFGAYQVLSSSPERMFLRAGSTITTGPIKGTIRRTAEVSDANSTALLLASEKDRAEHLMIVDLERNDLGRIAQTGSVHVPALFRPEKYSTLVHLVSDVQATVRPDVSLADIFAALLPGGSITGAPKRAAVRILSDIEETPRGYYTGCLGIITPDGADFNIAIRTLIHQDGHYHAHAGGGIVADSDPTQEYEELLLKAGNLFRALDVESDRVRI